MKFHFKLKEVMMSDERGFGLDQSFVTMEKFPLMISQPPQVSLHRIFKEQLNEQVL